ncbi:MAG: TAXI family TRAP transporter solute-binding subunit [Rickettsiales bacterium]
MRYCLYIIMCVLWSVSVQAEQPLGIVTGPKTGTYYAFGKDIAAIMNKPHIEIEVKESEGSIDNIKRINSAENAGVGIVQSDVLGFLSRSKNPDSIKMAENLRMIFPFYNEEIHVLARKEVTDFSQLAGKNVSIGEDGSGNMLTAINLLSIMNVEPKETRKMPPAEAVVAVLKGELDAVIFVGGKPVRLFKNLEDLKLAENKKYAGMLDQVHFLPMASPKMLEEYRPAKITSADYNFVSKPVPTIAVQAVMVSYSFKGANKERCGQIKKLSQAIRKNLGELKTKGHSKWKEVDLDAGSSLWKKDECAEDVKADNEKKELLKILEKK